MIVQHRLHTTFRRALHRAAPIGGVAAVLAVTLGLSACNGSNPVIVMQITTTPDPRIIQITVTNTAAQPVAVVPATLVPATVVPATPIPATIAPATVPATVPASAPTTVAPVASLVQPPIAASAVPVTAVPITVLPATQNPVAAPTNIAVPTETHSQLIIAHENFEHGYMFWVSVYKQNWVLLPPANSGTPGGTSSAQPPTNGVWMIFPDTFVDGEPEIDPALIPPSALLFQPRRGFGKLWRTNTQVHAALGWATTQEFGLTTSYVYQPGGYIDATTHQWVAGPGTHFLVTVSRETFAFHEPAPGQQFGTWEKVS